ncbi:HAD family hydrolase [Halorhabdus sp. CUG00001]|uniref:HAD family hydrolase n=1 Tax=Halorhabdus sp. CUG00001 TaxID=2600297 RepID=UPI00131D212F|nr:HAD family hydrolase [Halorhabdus sp. CUG00001]
MTLAAVVFDLDETLAVTTRDRQRLLADTATAAGLEPIEYGTYERAHRESVTGDTRARIFETLIDDESIDPHAVAETYRGVVNEHLEPIEGAEALLTQLTTGAGYRVGVLTDGPERAQCSKIEKLGWGDLLDATVVTGRMETRKPDPVAFEAVLGALSVDAEQAVYVGDKPEADVEGALDAGMRAIQVLYPGGPDPHPRADAHIERENLGTELPAVVESL